MAKFSLVLLGCVAVAFACLAAADVSVNIPGVVAPDIGAALNKAVQSGKLPGASAAKAGAAAPSAGVSAGQAKGQQAKGQQPQGNNADFATQLQAAGVGGRHLLQSQSCLFSGAIGSTGISVSNLCVSPPGATTVCSV